MALQEILDYISDNIIDNTDRLITPAVLRDVESAIVQWAEDNKVAKVSGEGLTPEKFTLAEKTKLSNAIISDEGIELDAGKRVKRVDGISLNTLKDTGPYEGLLVANSNTPDNFDGPRFIVWVLNYSADGDNLVQFALDASGHKLAIRSSFSDVFSDWDYLLTKSDKTELLERINKLSIEDIDLSDSELWSPATKTIDLFGKEGILNFNSTFNSVTIEDITEAEIAILTFADVQSAKLFQNDQLINFSSIEGGNPFTDLNSGDYMIKNLSYTSGGGDGTFEIYESDGTTPVNTLKANLTSLTNVTINSQAVFTADVADNLVNGFLVELSDMSGMSSLEGVIYEVQDLSGSNFSLYDPIAQSYANTTGMTYGGGGEVVTAAYFDAGVIDFKDGIINVNISKVTGIENGSRLKFTVSEDNEVEFNKKLLSVANEDDIVGSETLIVTENTVIKSLRNKGLNWMKQEFESD